MASITSNGNQRAHPVSKISTTLIQDNVSLPSVSESALNSECMKQEAGTGMKSGFEDQSRNVYSYLGSATRADDSEELIITKIRATDVATSLRRLPVGFYTSVQHSGREWRTENKPVSVNDEVIEWRGPIPLPSDLSATICFGIYASFVFQPMLGVGEQLRTFTITLRQLLDCHASDLPFTFHRENDDIISPCSSVLVTVRQQKRGSSDSATSWDLGSHFSATELRDQVEEATSQGHIALSRYRKYGEYRDLECSLKQFELVVDVYPLDHPCRAAAQSNLAMATLIHCRADDVDTSLDVPLTLYHDVLAKRPAGHPDRPSTLIQLAIVHLTRFEKRRNEADATQAKALLCEAVDLTSVDSHENRAATFLLQLHSGNKIVPARVVSQSPTKQQSASGARTLDAQPLRSFERLCSSANLQWVVSALEASIQSTVSDIQYNLGVSLSNRFLDLGELSDLEQAIASYRNAIRLTPDGHSGKPCRLNNLGNTFFTRFDRLGELSDLEQAILWQKDAVNITPLGHHHKADHLYNLGISLKARFERLGELTDIEQAISIQQDAVDLTPDCHPNKPRYLDNLCGYFFTRFQRVDELGDLEHVISRLRDAVDLVPDTHPDRPHYLCSLGNAFFTRFQRVGELGDLEHAISRCSDAVGLTPDDHPHKAGYLNQLSNFFEIRFHRLSELSNPEQAISRYRDALDVIPDDQPDKSCHLHNLGNRYFTRFLHLGELGDIDQAVSTHRGAVDLTPDGHPHKSVHLSSLGSCFIARFWRFGEPSDLMQGILRHKVAVNIASDYDPHKPGHLNNLGVALRTLFERTGRLGDLEEAISCHRDAVHLTPDRDRDKPLHVRNLGISLRARFHCLGKSGDLEQALSRHREAVDITPDGHPHKSGYLRDLGSSLFSRFKQFGELSDLEEAISRQQQVVDLTPKGDHETPIRLALLAESFKARSEYLGRLSDLEQAISLYSLAACASSGTTIDRFHASREWISSARSIRHRTLLHAYSVAISLLPQLAWIGLPLMQRYSELVQAANMVREAAATALDLGDPETAVEWLEQGRSIVWGELFELRSSYAELSSAHPDHARRLQELSAALENTSSSREKIISLLSEQGQDAGYRGIQSLEQEAMRHRARAIERDKLLQEIRALPGFERFLLRKEFSQLRASAQFGPVVFLNAAESRCDALIVLADHENVIHVPLPNFTLKRSGGLHNMLNNLLGPARGIPSDDRTGQRASLHDFSWESILSTLWRGVVKPVLDALGISTPGNVSRIFWCPTGPFAFLPIHAAGLYDTQYSEPGHKVFDFVISSYIPTLNILMRSIRDTTSGDFRMLIIPQPPSDGQAPLPGVRTELEYVRAAIRNSPAQITLCESSMGTVEEVLSLMKDADWVHFACHGIQDSENFSNSGLCLADERRLKLLDMISLSRPRGGLAFLSACQTAMGEKRLSDEAIHMAAGMLSAGYKGVIATMWSISDRVAPSVARNVYEELFRIGTTPDYREAARALHNAVQRLRDTNASFIEWVPFIHMGL